MRLNALILSLLMVGLSPAASILAETSPVLQAFQTLHSSADFNQKVQAYIRHFDDTAAVHPEKQDIYLQQLILSRYFALMAQDRQDREAALLAFFQNSPWSTQTALLDVFSKMQSSRISAALLDTAAKEPDEDKKLTLEEVALQSQPDSFNPQATIGSAPQLVQDWSVYLAKGNTLVVQATLDLLANTTTGYSTIVNGAGQAKRQLFPAMAQLKALALDITDYFLLNDAAIRTLILNNHEVPTLTAMMPTLKKLALTALANGDAELMGRSLIALGNSWDMEPEKTFYRGLEAGLKGQQGILQRDLTTLKNQSSPYALGLMGWEQHHRFLSGQSKWQYKPLNMPPAELAAAAVKALDTWTTWFSFQAITNIKPSGRHMLGLDVLPLVVCARTPSGGVLCSIAAEESDCLMLHQEMMTRWSSSRGQWSDISNFLIYDQLQAQFSQEALKTFLQTHRPSRTVEIERPGTGRLIGLTYLLASATALPEMPQPPGVHPVQLVLYLDQQTQLPSGLEITYQLNQSPSPAFASLTTFSTGDPFLLDWLKH